ncbi:DNA repair protein RecO [Aquiflexum gelatinilyticum]|uniref:DNA repair protein RecO n=1 Tax=Aquiflexum gelatinilyticum TaxID=2961943 RepID=UPI002166D4C9|nr:DNA repair protein RecO [Aquiflexum gelatinilyticum]
MRLKKTKGIVLSYIKYSETSIIVRVFTREFGLKSYIVNGVRSKSTKSKMAIYQPLTLLDLVVYDKEGSNLNRISEAKLLAPFQLVPFDFLRSGIAMFMAEVMGKSVFEGYQNEEFYDFLESAIQLLDDPQTLLKHFPLVFLWESSKYLGFAPEDSESFFFELKQYPEGPDVMEEEKDYLRNIIAQSFYCEDKSTSKTRKNMLDHFLIFYGNHLELAGDWKSIKVLRQMMY